MLLHAMHACLPAPAPLPAILSSHPRPSPTVCSPSGSHHYSTTETHGGTMQMLDVKVQLPGGNRRIPPG